MCVQRLALNTEVIVASEMYFFRIWDGWEVTTRESADRETLPSPVRPGNKFEYIVVSIGNKCKGKHQNNLYSMI